MTAPIPRDIPDLPALPGMPAPFPSYVPATAVLPPVRRPLVAVFRLLIALAALTAVTLELLHAGPAKALSHFTIQSGILLALVMIASAGRAWTAQHPVSGALTGTALLYVLIAGAVHHTLLANGAPLLSLTGGPTTGTATQTAAQMPWQTLAHHTLHTAIPLAALVDWLLLSPPGRLHLRQAAAWLLYPLAYLAFSLARGTLLDPGTPARYLYPFLDVDQHGYKGVLGNALLLGLCCYALAVLLVGLDHARPNPIRHRGKTGFRLQPPVG
ncbi:Pr6Pr family membrane protein [Streptomyces sp. DH24]|uniref:Pr6Pr family membrane protein n=1 Tax=Streptomyces sp. DH24 TaxID=3040123 RepID=UPI002440FFFC|nr:Pr6Pr family membrane protein [Streptomyces sp. DH24]MDG9717362.1 Pr6Pr family membrane protein [Streptomyces sp. DH24]